MTYAATCGTVTGTGVFTAPAGGLSCLVTATSGDKADTTEVVPLTSSLDFGVPFGIYDVWTSGTTTKSTGIAAFSSSHDYIAPGEMANHIATARAKGMHVVLAMTGGSHDRYKTAGVFDMAKWKAAVDAYNTQPIRDAIAQGVADGTVVGNSVMDEPHQYDGLSPDPTKSLGSQGHDDGGEGGYALRLREDHLPDSTGRGRPRSGGLRARQLVPRVRPSSWPSSPSAREASPCGATSVSLARSVMGCPSSSA